MMSTTFGTPRGRLVRSPCPGNVHVAMHEMSVCVNVCVVGVGRNLKVAQGREDMNTGCWPIDNMMHLALAVVEGRRKHFERLRAL
jgi:hypothetical protein